jgi:hypothetical protein
MPRVCVTCRHPERDAIDADLVSGNPLRDIAMRFGTSKSSLERHRDKCLPAHLSKAKENTEIQSASALVRDLGELTRKTSLILTRALAQKDPEVALKAIARLERQLELKARLLGELEERGNVGPTQVIVQYVDRQLNINGQPATQLLPNAPKALLP